MQEKKDAKRQELLRRIQAMERGENVVTFTFAEFEAFAKQLKNSHGNKKTDAQTSVSKNHFRQTLKT